MREEAIEYVKSEFAQFHRTHEIPGIAYGLMHQGELIYSSGEGERILGSAMAPNGDTVFRIASMTKSFTATAILALRDNGLLNLDAALSTYLPWSSTIGLPRESTPLTIRDVLTMGAGLPTDDPWGDRQESLPISEFDEMVKAGLSFNRSANTAFEYSNLSYALLGRVISEVTGESYENYITNHILKPLGMRSSTFLTDEIAEETRAIGYATFASGLTAEAATKHGAFTPMGGLHSTVHDLAKWVASYQAGRSEEQTPYRFASAWSAAPENDLPERIVASSYGYGLFVDDDALLGRSIHHSGGYPGFGSHMRWHQSSGWAIIALGNLTYAPMRLIGAKIINHLAQVSLHSQQMPIHINPASSAAMDGVIKLLNQWDDNLASQLFAENMELDQPREERIADVVKLTLGKSEWHLLAGSITALTPSSIKWSVVCDEETLEVELLMSPEKIQKIQKLTLRRTTTMGE